MKTREPPSGFLALPKPNRAGGIQRLIRGIKSLSHLFFYKEDTEEMEPEMEIGYPTDVKHVTHIGLDGSATTIQAMAWDYLKQFELAMPAQVDQPLVTNPSSEFG